MTRRDYSDSERATALAALDANGGNVAATARTLQIPRSTLQEWANGRVNSEVTELRQEKKRDLAERLEDIAHELVDALPDKIGRANLQQTATTLGIVIDKMQLLKGEPTNIQQDYGDLTDEERSRRIAAIFDAARARRDGQVSGTVKDA